jgi:predicted nucleotidyltransferase
MNTARQLTAETSRIPALVKQTVLAIAPDAEVYLYGSRARGDFEADSDWDFLVLCGEGNKAEVKEAISAAMYTLESELCDALGHWPCFSTVVRTPEYWSRKIVQATPFHREVTKDGVRI